MSKHSDYTKEVNLALEILGDVLKGDPQYYYVWQASIAMTFQDKFKEQMGADPCMVSREDLHKISNDAAKDFIDFLIRELAKHKD